jgi:hypothetical protein
MRTRDMDDEKGSYSYDKEIKGLHVRMGNVETDSNGRIGRKEPVTMRILQREVQRYRVNNENTVKD